MGGRCCTFTLGSDGPAAVNGTSFLVPIQTKSGISYKTTMRGSFSSGSSASGSIDTFPANGLICGGGFTIGTPVTNGGETWNASKR